MGSFVEALFSACVAAAIVWALMRRGAGGATASTTAEIERLKAVVEELTAALEHKAEAAEQRLAKAISEAQGVQSVLDRTLAAVGAQLVRPEAVAMVSPPQPAAAETPKAPAIPVRPTVPNSTPIEAPIPEPMLDSAPAIRSMSEEVQPAQLVEPVFVMEPVIALATESTDAVAEPEPAQEPVANPAVEGGIATMTGPAGAAQASSLSQRDAKDTAEREARVMSLVARGVTNSVDLARQTGLTRGEVELILTLHNLHIAPGGSTPAYGGSPGPSTPAYGGSPVEPTTARAEPKPAQTADEIVVDPNDRYAAIYALIAAGVTDSVEIARRTGLGRGEVELHMGLHARNVL